jgi:hypothetical protein
MQYGFWELFQSVTNFRLVCLLPIVAYTYILFFFVHVLGYMKNLKNKIGLFLSILYIYIYIFVYTSEN